MAKKRIYEVAKEVGVDNKVVVQKAKDLGFDVKNHMSSIDDVQAAKLKSSFQNSAPAKKNNKIKISVSSIRKNEKKQENNNSSKKPRRRNNKRRQNNDRNRDNRNERGNNRANSGKPKAAALLQQFKQKQRAEEGQLNKEAQKAKKEYHEQLKHPKQEQPVKNNKKTNNDNNKKKSAPVEKKVIGPKILKPSPARLKQNQPSANERVAAKVTMPEAPKDDRRGNGHGRNTGKPGRKGKSQFFNGHSEHSDRSERKRRKNRKKQQEQKPKKQPTKRKERPLPEVLVYEEGMNAQDLGKLLHREPAEIVKKLFMLGVLTNQNQSLDKDTIELLAAEYGIDAKQKVHEDISDIDTLYNKRMEESKKSKNQVKRPPVVTIMGHVDHGKTSLLDAIRQTNVIDREAGGITQHIGASVVEVNGEKITFLDTPGHEAFTAMRMRGASSTDIAILVVAADDGVMPQTVEAINHAKAAGVEIIVAVNKIDKPSANVDRVKQELTEYELIAEDWGGSTIFVPVSAKTGEGLEELMEMILLTAEVMELKANPNRRARGLVLEAQLDKGRGPVATVLVQKGTLRVGDAIAAGSAHGKVRAMMDDKGRRVKEAGPSVPVEILGLDDVPNAGEVVVCCKNEKEARSFAETFIAQNKVKLLEDTKSKLSLDDLFTQIQEGNLKELDLIVKADVQGSVEAVKQSLLKLSNDEVIVKVIHGGVGAINESDVSLASASNAIIIGFNVRPDATAKETAEREGVDVRLYRVIYNAIEDVEAAMKGMLDPVFEEKVLGHAEVRQTFKASGVGTIAGSYVLDGLFERDCSVRLTRDGIVIFEGPLASLKRFKDDVKEVKAGYECGFVFANFNDIKEGDLVEAFKMVEVPR